MGDTAACGICGSEWWKLAPDPESTTPPRVTLDDRGVVIGFSGKPVCETCGTGWQPRPALRLVE